MATWRIEQLIQSGQYKILFSLSYTISNYRSPSSSKLGQQAGRATSLCVSGAEGFFCNLDILHGGLGIGKLQFLKKKKKNLIFSCNFFFNFWSLKPWIRIGSGSGLVSSLKLCIRIRKKWIRIHNPDLKCCVALIRLEKRVDELLKQNASLETLSKGQEQALTKKEKQLQVSSYSDYPVWRSLKTVLRIWSVGSICFWASLIRIHDSEI